MNKIFTKIGLAAALASTALVASSPAMARGYHRGGDDAAIAIGAGVLGLAVGAAIADRGDRYYYDRDYYDTRRYVRVDGRPDYYYYYVGRPNVYYRDRYYDRYYGTYYRRNYYRDDRYRGRPYGWGRYYDRRDYRDHRGEWRGRDWRDHDRRGWHH